MSSGPLAPGARIGILGTGQLGRMSALSAARLGYRTHVFGPEADGPGMQVATARTCAAYDDTAALTAFAGQVDVVTFEFENVPHATLAALDGRVACAPGAQVLANCQDRLVEKRFMAAAGVPVGPWAPVESAADLAAAIAAVGLPAVLKTTRLGYDGRGQAVVHTVEDAKAALARLAPHPLILEAFIPFVAEISAIVARGTDGSVVSFDAVENRHTHHILDLSFAPARIPAGVGAAARRHAMALATAQDLVGVLAVEFFLLADGRLLGNEMAPRPHNSGHWTMDACDVSQFDLHIRAIAGWPLTAPARHADAVMRNLIGAEGMARCPAMMAMPGVALHLYGKAEARPGRKMGHATRCLPLGALGYLPDAGALGEL
ncbi:5-(carboxyamino)imidazole ribonucleotide synthase [Humitalea sp. 24SJ18S-53]|uniref:5-(carboxyamino)imidazole ribonucleotide synthase n=1 Tax=Humitalea sp. 24SJ18S-53 TaxID=3422307 RepID=UPI003D67297F